MRLKELLFGHLADELTDLGIFPGVERGGNIAFRIDLVVLRRTEVRDRL